MVAAGSGLPGCHAAAKPAVAGGSQQRAASGYGMPAAWRQPRQKPAAGASSSAADSGFSWPFAAGVCVCLVCVWCVWCVFECRCGSHFLAFCGRCVFGVCLNVAVARISCHVLTTDVVNGLEAATLDPQVLLCDAVIRSNGIIGAFIGS